MLDSHGAACLLLQLVSMMLLLNQVVKNGNCNKSYWKSTGTGIMLPHAQGGATDRQLMTWLPWWASLKILHYRQDFVY